MTSRFRHCLSLLFILLLAFALRSYHLEAHSLRGDEAATVLYAALPLTDLWELSRITDPHPPLYYALLHPWQLILGEAAWTMRFFGVLASTLSVAVLYRLARLTVQLTDISLLAAFLLAINPLQIWLAQDVRSYPLFTLMGLLSSSLLWLTLHPPIKKSPLSSFLSPPLYILFTVAGLYIHYYTIFLIAFQGLFVLLNYRHFWPKRWLWLTGQLIIALLILPGLSLAYGFIGEAAGGIDTLPLSEILWRAATALLTGFTLEAEWGRWVSLALMPLWLLGLTVLLSHHKLAGSFWGLFFLIPVGGVIALSIDRPFFKERFLIQAQPAFCLLLATGFLTLKKLRRPIDGLRIDYLGNVLAVGSFLGLLWLNGLALNNYFYEPAYAKAKPWRLYHDYVTDRARPGDVMLTNFPEAAVSYYSPNALPFFVVPEERDRSVTYRLERTTQIAQAYDRIWFVPLMNQGFDETGAVLHWLDRHADRVNQIFFPTYNLNLYLSPPTIERLMIRQPVTFAHKIQLLGYQIFDKQGDSRLESPSPANEKFILTIKPEQPFNLSLYWQAHQPTARPYTVFVHLIAEDGFNRTSQDNQPVWGSYPTTDWPASERITDKYQLTIPVGSPAGDHQLRVGWYDSQTGERVNRLNSEAEFILLDVMIRVEETN